MRCAFQLPYEWFFIVWPNNAFLSLLFATELPVLLRKREPHFFELLHLLHCMFRLRCVML